VTLQEQVCYRGTLQY